MNDRLHHAAPSPISPLRAAEAPAEEDPRRDDEGRAEELDKYDISTLACTD